MITIENRVLTRQEEDVIKKLNDFGLEIGHILTRLKGDPKVDNYWLNKSSNEFQDAFLHVYCAIYGTDFLQEEKTTYVLRGGD